MKKCSTCKETKEQSEYYGKKGVCKSCHKKAVKEYRDKNPQLIKKTNLMRCYGLTLEEFESMREAQGGKCKICGKDEKEEYYGTLHVDHCHTTGKVRGLLCKGCNHGLGNFMDSVELMKKGIDYLNG